MLFIPWDLKIIFSAGTGWGAGTKADVPSSPGANGRDSRAGLYEQMLLWLRNVKPQIQ